MQTFNLYLIHTSKVDPTITAAFGSLIAAGTMFIHLMGMATPTDSQIIQLGLSQPPAPPPPVTPQK